LTYQQLHNQYLINTLQNDNKEKYQDLTKNVLSFVAILGTLGTQQTVPKTKIIKR